MKRRNVLVICILLMAAIALSGCSSEKDALVGVWQGSIDMTDYLNKEISSGVDAETAEFFKIDNFALEYEITFTEDDTYSLTVNRGSLDATIQSFMADLEEGVYEYLVYMIDKEGIDMDVETFLSLSGTSIEEMMEESFPEAEIYAMMDESISAMEMSGNFKVKDNKLMLSDGYDYQPDPNVYETYTLDGSTLTISKGSSDVNELEDLVYPMILQKAA